MDEPNLGTDSGERYGDAFPTLRISLVPLVNLATKQRSLVCQIEQIT